MGNEFVARYCHTTGVQPEEIINKRRDRRSLTVRNSLMHITWEHRRHQISHGVKKKQVLIQIGREFGMSRNNCYEQLDTFAANLAVNSDLRQSYEEIRGIVL